ncbi:MAG: hypothetical protein AB1405_16680, partial [Bdellovibrionota bacterium]
LCGGSLFTAGVDLRKSVYGIELYTQDNPSNIVVDGKMNETEKNIVRAKQNWIVGYKEKDQVGIVVRVLFDEELQKKGAELEFTLLDDASAKQEPEDEPGVHFFGYDVDLLKFPKGKYNVIFYQYIAFNFKKGDEQQFLHVLDHPLRTRAGGL